MTLIEDQTYQPKILVVDDEKRIREGCFKILTKENCLVDMAESGETGLTMIGEKHYDIILTDLMMPGIGGMEVLAKVREQHPDSVSIVITGFATLEHSIEAMKKGAFDFIPKPFTPDQLRENDKNLTGYCHRKNPPEDHSKLFGRRCTGNRHDQNYYPL